MNPRARFLLYQICRFGALNAKQMLEICDGYYKKTNLYRRLHLLTKEKLITNLCPTIGEGAIMGPTPKALKLVFGENHFRTKPARQSDLDHAEKFADVMTALGKYEFVTGIATEYEISPQELSLFALNRIPDGIIQVSRNNIKFELAVEVEHSSKNFARISEILSTYQKTISRQMQCEGVMFVCCDDGIFNSYREQIEKLPSDIERRMVLVKINEINHLEERFYGRFGMRPNQGLNYRRNHFTSGIKYFPIISREDEKKFLLKGGYFNTQTRINNEVKI